MQLEVETKYTRRERQPFADLPEPLGLMKRIALYGGQPLSPLARSLDEHNWLAPIEQIAKEIGQDPDQIRKTANLLTGVLRLEVIGDQEMISLMMPTPLNEQRLKAS